MKLGFGLYYYMLDDARIEDSLKFARQCGASHVVVHLTDYFHNVPELEDEPVNPSENQPVGKSDGWGLAGSNPHVWELDYLQNLKDKIERHNLQWYAVENFDPADWYAVLLGLPERSEQVARLKRILNNLGRVGVKCFGYNFSLAGVAMRQNGPYARGGADSVGMDGVPPDMPIPAGMIWNMIYDLPLYLKARSGGPFQPQCAQEELWERLNWFLKEMIPEAEKSGIMLCAHPDDPPLKTVRRQPRLVWKPELYQKLVDLQQSSSNGLELCLGTLQEMQSDEAFDVYYWLEHYLEQNRIGYIHLRNVRGKIPHYKEVFIDEGDLDVKRIISILRKYDFNGIIIPDHAPQMSCASPWHSGMAFAMGYLKSLIE